MTCLSSEEGESQRRHTQPSSEAERMQDALSEALLTSTAPDNPLPKSEHTALLAHKRCLQGICAHHHYSVHVGTTFNGFYFN